MQAFRIPVTTLDVCEWLIKPVVMIARVRFRGSGRACPSALAWIAKRITAVTLWLIRERNNLTTSGSGRRDLSTTPGFGLGIVGSVLGCPCPIWTTREIGDRVTLASGDGAIEPGASQACEQSGHGAKASEGRGFGLFHELRAGLSFGPISSPRRGKFPPWLQRVRGIRVQFRRGSTRDGYHF